jgi:hypothetical protein
MSLKKNISGGELDVPLLGRSVADGEVVEVPDFQPGHTAADPLPIAWPPDKWADAGTAASAAPETDGDSISAEGM